MSSGESTIAPLPFHRGKVNLATAPLVLPTRELRGGEKVVGKGLMSELRIAAVFDRQAREREVTL